MFVLTILDVFWTMTSQEARFEKIAGCLLGTALGDSLGLPYEGLAPARAGRLMGQPDRHRFLLGRGMFSDDTEQTILIALAWLRHPHNPSAFQRDFANGLKRWLLCIPAGAGLATVRACLRLLAGVNPGHSGVNSAGNGAAMRSAILGAVGATRDHVKESASVTHRDPRAVEGSLLVAEAARLAGPDQPEAQVLLARLSDELPGDQLEFKQLLKAAAESLAKAETTRDFAASIGLENGVSGYVLHTVPVAFHAWLSAGGDFTKAAFSAIECGGDSDTVAAIACGLCGAEVGLSKIPQWMLDGLAEPIWSKQNLIQLSRALAETEALQLPKLRSWLTPLRNSLFLAVVLAHGFRRLLPPYR